MAYKNLLKGGTSLLLHTNAIFSSIHEPQHSHTQIMKLNKKTVIKNSLLGGSFPLYPGDFQVMVSAHTCLGDDSKGWQAILNEH